jgi:deoxyribonuclease-4
VPAIAQVLERCAGDTWLCVENCAGTGGTIGRSVKELATILERLDRHPRLGVCLDTCHLYASGYDVTDRDALDRLLQEVDATVGLDRVRCLHVNDSKAGLGSNRDRHENVGEGLMGNRIGVFLAHPDLQGLPATLETPGRDNHGPDAAQIQLTKDLWRRFRRSGGSRRRRGTSARPPAARRTRG